MARTGKTTHKNWRKKLLIQAKQNHQTNCLLCHVPLAYGTHGQPNSPEADHIKPIALGGKNTTANGRIICRKCNIELGHQTQQLLAKQKGKNKPKKSYNSKQIEPKTSFVW